MENKSLTCHTTSEMRLIDANLLVSDLAHSPDYSAAVFQKIAKIVHDSPTVDAVEVVHGEWTTIEDDWMMDTIYKCSVCKEEFVTVDGTPAENLWNYCPNCGALMDGGNEDG